MATQRLATTGRSTRPNLLKVLLRQRHWQPYATFTREYDHAAKRVEPDLIGSWPSRAQFNRWLSGQLKGPPYPHHCRILEEMFQGWSAEQLFEPADPSLGAPSRRELLMDGGIREPERLFAIVQGGLAAPDATHATWESHGASTVAASRLTDEASDVTRRISERLVNLGHRMRLSGRDLGQLAALAGNIVDLDLKIELTIDRDGPAVVTYRHELFNMTDRPFTRLSRELWFVHTTGPLEIQPTGEGANMVIQRAATTPNLAKFSCKISPALAPGDSAVVAYTCHGGKFVDEWYWHEAIRRHTRYATVVMRGRDAGELLDCSATVEQPDGSERSALEGLVWDRDRNDLVITLTSDYLNPNQIITLRWELNDESA